VTRWFVALAACTVFSACGGGGDPATPDVVPTITVTAAGSTSIVSGGGLQLAATLTDNRGRPVSGPTFTWSSADATIATVAPTGLVVGVKSGTTSISAASGTTTGSIAVTVTPGAPARLVVTTQPAGAASGVVLVTQPVVEVRDISDNLVTNAQIDVQASPTSGTLIGTTVVRTQQGVARFTDLGVSGTVGTRAIVFSAGSLANGVSGNFELTAGPLAAVGFVGTAPRVRSGIASGASVVAQLRDANGNAVARGGRQLTITVTGGTGTTTSSGTTAVTDGQGRATFPAFTVTGLAGQRTMTLRADSIAPVAVGTLILVGGAPTRVVVDRDLPTTIEAGVVMAPAPSVRLMDSVGNFAPEAGVTVTATSSSAALTSPTAVTDTAGRATFTALAFTAATTAGSRTVQFSASNITAAQSRAVNVQAADLTPQPTTILTAASSADTLQRTIEFPTTTSVFTPFFVARDALGQPMATAGVRWSSRDPTRVAVSANGQLTGLLPGRTFVVAQASRSAAVADSVLVFTPKSGTGAIVRATLPSYRITTDTFSITIEIAPRDGRPLGGANLEIAWPGSRSNPFSPFNVEAFTTLSAGVQAAQADFQDALRVTWAPTAPVSGRVGIVRLRCRVNRRNAGNEMAITLNQLLQGDLTDITSAASVFNPVVIIP